MQRREFVAAAGVSYNKRMARPVCKSFRVSCLFQSAVTYPASRLCPEPRWRFAHPGPHNYLRRRAPLLYQASGTPFRLSGHLASTTCKHRQSIAGSLSASRTAYDRPIPKFAGAAFTPRPARRSWRTSLAGATPPRQCAPACWLEQPRPRSCAPARAGPSPSVRAACLSVQDAAEPPARHGSASCADICCRAC